MGEKTLIHQGHVIKQPIQLNQCLGIAQLTAFPIISDEIVANASDYFFKMLLPLVRSVL
jgi:hypothetical protein